MDYVSISGVVSCHSCPLRYYLERSLSDSEESPEYTMAKQISYHLGSELIEDEIWEEIKVINPEIGDDFLPILKEWLDACRKTRWPAHHETDLPIKSYKLGISGRMDMFFESDPKPGIVRAAPAPDTGFYGSDRIRSAMVAICAGETLGEKIDEVQLLYIPSGTARTFRPGPAERRAALRALSYAKKIDRGYVPKKPKDPPCEYCRLRDSCSPEPQNLSEVFRF